MKEGRRWRRRRWLSVSPSCVSAFCRYSQFLQLHQALVTRHHGQALRGFSFPKKQLTNNFRPDVLEERRLAFRSG